MGKPNKKTVVSGSDKTLTKNPPKKTSKEETHSVVSSALSELKDHAESLTRLVQSLERTLHADAAVVTVKDTMNVIGGMEKCRKQMILVRDTLKSRVRTALNEL